MQINLFIYVRWINEAFFVWDIAVISDQYNDGAQDFLSACGRRISRLDVECGAEAVISAADLVALATTCTQLEAVAFTNFRVVAEVCVRTSI